MLGLSSRSSLAYLFFLSAVTAVAAITITPTTLSSGNVTAPYSGSVSASGGVAPYTFAVVGDAAAPAGLTLLSNGSFTGVPIVPGTFTPYIEATDANGATGTQQISIRIFTRPVVFDGGSLPAGTVAKPYAASVSATDGTSPFQYSVASGSALPGGLILSTNGGTGYLGGTPTTAGNFSFAITVTDGGGVQGSATFTISVAPVPTLPEIDFVQFSPATQFLPAGGALTARGGTPPYTWSLAAGSLPSGVTLLPTGFLQGTPLTAGVFSFSPRVTDSLGASATIALTLTVNPSAVNSLLANPSLVSFTLPAGTTKSQPSCISVFSTQGPMAIAPEYSATGTWLTITGVDATSTPVSYCFTADPSGLAPGNFIIFFRVRGTDSGASVGVEVRLTVQQPNPANLNVSPLSVKIPATKGSGPVNSSVVLSNSGGIPLTYSVRRPEAIWLTNLSTGGSLAPGASASLGLKADTAGLSAGVYHTTLVIDTATQQRSVDVELAVSESPGLLSLSQTAVEFVGWAGGPLGSASTGVINIGASPLIPELAINTGDGRAWLAAQVSGASLAAGAATPLEITVNPATLAAGRYSGSVTVTSATAGNGPQMAAVGLTVLAPKAVLPPDVQVTGIAMTTLAPQGKIALAVAPGAELTFTTVVAGAGSGWLHVSPTQGNVPQDGALKLTATGDAAGMSPGLYAAAIGIGLSDGTSRSVPVEFFVPVKATQAARQATAVCTQAGSFVAHLLSPVPNFFVRTGRALPVRVQAENCDGTPASKLEITGQYGTQSLTLLPDGPGVWSTSWVPAEASATAQMNVAVSATQNGQRVTTALSAKGVVSPSAVADPLVTAVVGGANPAPNDPVAVGSWISIYGSNFATAAATAQTETLPVTLGGIEVFLGEESVRLYYVGPQQVNGIVPRALSPGQRYQLVLRRNGTPAAPFAVTVTDVQPGLFTQNQQGSGQAAAVLAGTRTLAAAGTAVERGGVIELYATGMGAVENSPADGAPASLTALSRVVREATVTVGGRAARVLFAGLTPGTIGLYQMNVEIPADAPVGDAVPVVVTQKGVASNAAMIAVR